MNMRYFWMLCHDAQKTLNVSYHPGQENLGDYPTKVHNGAHHLRMRPFYQHMKQSPRFLPRTMRPSDQKGCVGGIMNPYVRTIPLPKILPLYRLLATTAG